MDIIELKSIPLKALIGVYAWEKQVRQQIIVDLSFAVDVRKASESDDLTQTIDYDAIISHLKHFVAENQFNLLETLAHKLSDSLLETFNMPYIKLSINKPFANLNAKAITLTIERTTQ